MTRIVTLAVIVVFGLAAPARAQHEQMNMSTASPKWTWSFEANATLDGNLLERKFRDFHQIESQNWFMVMACRSVGKVHLMIHGMFSLEPFTERAQGSADVSRTGETYRGAPLIGYQHPHDLFMAIASHIDGPVAARARWSLDAARCSCRVRHSEPTRRTRAPTARRA